MSDVAIKVENLGKQYRLGEIGTGTLSHDLNRAWARLRGKEDPFAKIGETNDRTTKGTSDFVWSLKDVNFEVTQGEVLGIIGRNGAGKSTLLKILSKVTAPTTGSVKVRGRIASLLEVGTGFHPELTGRENIFLNGAILGMTKAEIRSKFDEIVDFSGVERYIDTPVKRYSSGMYVRLAFAVAAFLEPEILIVDEVLAVGDAEFQKKCLGRMKDVSMNDGRTILFVSHNLAAVHNICSKGICLRTGSVSFEGNAHDAIANYINGELSLLAERTWTEQEAPGSDVVRITSAKITSGGLVTSEPYIDKEFELSFEFQVFKDDSTIFCNIQIMNNEGVCVLSSVNWPTSTLNIDPWSSRVYHKGRYKTKCTIPGNYLNEGGYSINFLLLDEANKVHTQINEALQFTVHDTGHMRGSFLGSWIGVVRPKLAWATKDVSNY